MGNGKWEMGNGKWEIDDFFGDCLKLLFVLAELFEAGEGF